MDQRKEPDEKGRPPPAAGSPARRPPRRSDGRRSAPWWSREAQQRRRMGEGVEDVDEYGRGDGGPHRVGGVQSRAPHVQEAGEGPPQRSVEGRGARPTDQRTTDLLAAAEERQQCACRLRRGSRQDLPGGVGPSSNRRACPPRGRHGTAPGLPEESTARPLLRRRRSPRTRRAGDNRGPPTARARGCPHRTGRARPAAGCVPPRRRWRPPPRRFAGPGGPGELVGGAGSLPRRVGVGELVAPRDLRAPSRLRRPPFHPRWTSGHSRVCAPESTREACPEACSGHRAAWRSGYGVHGSERGPRGPTANGRGRDPRPLSVSMPDPDVTRRLRVTTGTSGRCRSA